MACENRSGIMDQLANSAKQRIKSRSFLSNSNRAYGLTAELPQHFRLFIAYICTNLMIYLDPQGLMDENIPIVEGNDMKE